MTFHIITIFPEIFNSYFEEGVINRAWKLKKTFDIKVYNLRDYTEDKHKTVDDTPYGGGPGMVLKVEPIYRCLEQIKKEIVVARQEDENFQFPISNFQTNSKFQIPNSKIILFSAKGARYNQIKAKEYSQYEHIIMICGRYEGVDERVADNLVDEEISVGNYILTGGELPAMILVDSVARLIPGVLGNPMSLDCETYDTEETDYPVYTKPEEFNGWQVPEVLVKGNHQLIEKWRKEKRESNG